MNEEMFYGTLPQDTQDFGQVLRGVGRNLRDITRGVSYYPYDLVGAPVDLINMALQPVGLGSDQPILGSDYLRNIAQSLGLANPSTGSGAETAGRFGAAFVNPAAGARAVGQASNLVTKGANFSADKLVQMITGNPQATAPRVLEETSMPFMQAVAPKAPPVPSLLEPTKSDIGFYSQLEAATIPLQNKGTGDQYLAQISKTAGVKPEEIQWTGLDEFLKGKKSVTRDEILDYLNTNRVDVKEVRLGEMSQKQLLAQQQAKNRYREITDAVADTRQKVEEGLLSSQEARAILEPLTAERSRLDSEILFGAVPASTKFSKYTLPGGENYREILLTLPQKRATEAEAKAVVGDARWNLMTPEQRQEFMSYPTDASKQNQFKSSHFDQPNILAHMRVNDRVVDGKKTLFIEEIQSDWHQAGRKKGYQTGDSTGALNAFKQYSWELAEKYDLNPEQNLSMYATMKGMQPEEVAKYEQLQTAWLSSKGGVPDAPFKTSWHELSLKRAIQEAAEKGYDQIAFTTGKTQAERYDLSKQIGQITARPTPDGMVALEALTPDLGEQVIDRVVKAEDLDDIVGKEIADKIRAQIEYPKNFDDRGKSVELSGLDLQVGGEGMKGFYDNILPKSLDKIGKKFDAKVTKSFIEGERTRDASGIPSMYPEKVEVWSMDITPKMRESVTTKGQPLFAVPAIGAGLLGAGMVQEEQQY